METPNLRGQVRFLPLVQMKNVIILDLDGVLITTPSWRRDELESDGYSKFNSIAVDNFNELTDDLNFELWLISDRRRTKKNEELNQIFKNRNIKKQIDGIVPIYGYISRKEEFEKFIAENNFDNFILIDDDSSLEGLSDKDSWIKTKPLIGFCEENLNETKLKTLSWKQKNILLGFNLQDDFISETIWDALREDLSFKRRVTM